jgi:hypothetical protein
MFQTDRSSDPDRCRDAGDAVHGELRLQSAIAVDIYDEIRVRVQSQVQVTTTP